MPQQWWMGNHPWMVCFTSLSAPRRDWHACVHTRTNALLSSSTVDGSFSVRLQGGIETGPDHSIIRKEDKYTWCHHEIQKCVCVHVCVGVCVHLQSIFQCPEAEQGLKGRSKPLLHSAQAEAWPNINTTATSHYWSPICLLKVKIMLSLYSGTIFCVFHLSPWLLSCCLCEVGGPLWRTHTSSGNLALFVLIHLACSEHTSQNFVW